jgi:hypothetical protein
METMNADLFENSADHEENAAQNGEGSLYPTHISPGILDRICKGPRHIFSNGILVLFGPNIAMAFTILHLLVEQLAEHERCNNVTAQRDHHHDQRGFRPVAVQYTIDGTENDPICTNQGITHLQAGFRQPTAPILILAGNLF